MIRRIACLACGLFVAWNSLLPAAEPAEADSPPVQWIWQAAERQGGQNVCFRREFPLNSVPLQAELLLLADYCHSKVYVNGTLVATGEPYRQAFTADVAARLVEGANTLEVCCRSIDGPAALMARLELISPAGREVIVTNSAWQAAGVAGGGNLELPKGQALTWQAAVSLGAVDPLRFGLDTGSIAIRPIDDYTQWKRAIGARQGTDPRTFEVLPGFQVDLIHSATEAEDSWVSLTADPQGRWIIGMEKQGLLRLAIGPEGEPVTVERINETLRECRGLQFKGNDLYALANNDKGLYRLRDTGGNGRFETVEKLMEFEGDVGHGRNQLTLGPDGQLYGIFGDSVIEPKGMDSPIAVLARPSTIDSTRNGFVARLGDTLASSQVLARGLRNPYGIAINAHGDMFTYDADAEYDTGSPWYRPTRMLHLIPGGDYRWRRVTKQWPPYFPDQADMPQPTLDIGKGSPTAVVLGSGDNFPPGYRDALYILDWAYGRIVAVHLTPHGSSYYAAPETFLRGQPLNVTDCEFGPDGAMYFVTGGRRTQSALYRVRFTGKQPPEKPATPQQLARIAHAEQSRADRMQLHRLAEQPQRERLDSIWRKLGSSDPWLRHAARTALEALPPADWQERALQEPRPELALPGCMALLRVAEEPPRVAIAERLCRLKFAEASRRLQLEALYLAEYLLADDSPLAVPRREELVTFLARQYPSDSWEVNRHLSTILAAQPSEGFVLKTMELLAAASGQKEKLHYMFVLRNEQHGWTPELRSGYFAQLQQLNDFVGGDGLPTFRQLIREEALASLPADVRGLYELLVNQAELAWVAEIPQEKRKLVRQWQVSDFEGDALALDSSRDLANGRKVFAAAACIRCHRIGTRGDVSGPDLTAVSRRFSPRDMLVSIIEPSQVIAEKYASSTFELADGRVLSGRIAPGDYRSPELEIVPNLLEPRVTQRIAKSEIVQLRVSPISPMPKGLLDTFERDDILDLLAYLMKGEAE